MARNTAISTAPMPNRTLIRWGAVFAGAVLGVATLIVLTAFVAALTIGGGFNFGSGISWWLALIAVLAVFVGGLFAGWLSGVRGVTSGIVNGLTVFGLMLITALVGGVPGALSLVPGLAEVGGQQTQLQFGQTASTAAWATFWGLLVGFGAAGAGGAVGGKATQPGAEQRGADGEFTAEVPHHTHEATDIRETIERVDVRGDTAARRSL